MAEFESRRTDVVVLEPNERFADDMPSYGAEARVGGGGDGDRADLRDVGRALWRRRWLIALCALGGTVLFYLLTASLPDRYSARATVMLDPREQRIMANEDQVVSDLELSNPIIESEVVVLRAPGLLTEVVREIGAERLAAVDPADAPRGLLSRLAGALRAMLPGAGANTGGTDTETPAEERRIDRIAASLGTGLTINRLGDSYVIEIRVESVDPEISALVANGLAEAYIADQLAERQRVAAGATRWLSTQVDQRRAELSEAEAEVEAYKREQLDLAGASVAVIEQQLAELNHQLALTRSDRASEEARLRQLDSLVADRGAAAAARTLDSPFLTTLREEREALLREQARLSVSLGENHPDRRFVASELARIDAAMADEVATVADGHRNEISVLETRAAALAGDVEALEERLSDISVSSLRLRALEREAEAARTGFEDLLGRLGETRAQVEIQRAEARLVDEAQVPKAPSAPRPALMGAFGGTLGLTVGMLAGLLLELARAGFVQARALEAATRMRVLTVLPAEALSRPRNVLRSLLAAPYSLYAERVRQLRTMMSMVTQGRSQSILLLSSVPREGKTTTALALAHVYARTGAATLVIDLDSRRSALQAELLQGMPVDLSDHILGGAPLEEAIVSLPDQGFDVAATGRHRALLADGVTIARMVELIDQLKLRYDVVLIDAPPVLAVSDGLALAGAVDAVLYLVRWRQTPRRTVQDGLTALKNVGVMPVGLVLTMADTGADPDAYAHGYTYD